MEGCFFFIMRGSYTNVFLKFRAFRDTIFIPLFSQTSARLWRVLTSLASVWNWKNYVQWNFLFFWERRILQFYPFQRKPTFSILKQIIYFLFFIRKICCIKQLNSRSIVQKIIINIKVLLQLCWSRVYKFYFYHL